ncbi:MAG: ArsJ-associated glyceraldehyde-3-phosphate dehydrogenase [Magnetococcales bacterium]|nr:ArsJ-associated glyceraldehyde-3-phosphate dehydrogenase [Magnetococcales bacterium]MBF0114507.1 ArsJ-associated glyceraldehyde-3-phosphate dehydrogenase [Magnetococcales bacterium]
MAIRVGINGFGRMGRLGLRAAWERLPELEFVHVNEIMGDAACAAHLLKYDSVHGRWDREVHADGSTIVIDGKRMGYSQSPSIAGVDWQGLGVELVLECTGKFKTMAALQPYFDGGVKKVVVACPVKESAALNVVVGVNDHLYDPARHTVVTAASCTTNCLAPVVKVMLEKIGIVRGSMTTIHNITNTQTIIDLGHKDLRRARANSLSLIPTSTGSAKAITQIFPELTGKINGIAVRVPLLNASLTDMVFETPRSTHIEEVNAFLKEAANGPLQGILGYEELPLVSIDYNNDTRSSIVDALSTMVIDGTHVKILAWYDNEVGYANRLVELASQVARSW